MLPADASFAHIGVRMGLLLALVEEAAPDSQRQMHPDCRALPREQLLPVRLRAALAHRRAGRWEQQLRRVGSPACTGPGLSQAVCPASPWSLQHGVEAHKYGLHYLERAAAGACNEARGMWASDAAAPATVCKLRGAARLAGVGRGSRVLDLGAGCGHQLHHLVASFGVQGVGVELIDENVAWARQRFPGEFEAFCAADITSPHGLPFLPNASFDFIYSNAVLREMPLGYQCAVARLSLRLLKPGGCAWFGFLRDSTSLVRGQFMVQRNVRSFWRRPGCLSAAPVRARGRVQRNATPSRSSGRACPSGARRGFHYATVLEQRFFGTVEYPNTLGKGAYSVILCTK